MNAPAFNIAVLAVALLGAPSALAGQVNYTFGLAFTNETIPSPHLDQLVDPPVTDAGQTDEERRERYHHVGTMPVAMSLVYAWEYLHLGLFAEVGFGVDLADAADDPEATEGYRTYSYSRYYRTTAGPELALLTGEGKIRGVFRFRAHMGKAYSGLKPSHGTGDKVALEYEVLADELSVGVIVVDKKGRPILIDVGYSFGSFVQKKSASFTARDALGEDVDVTIPAQRFANHGSLHLGFTVYADP